MKRGEVSDPRQSVQKVPQIEFRCPDVTDSQSQRKGKASTDVPKRGTRWINARIPQASRPSVSYAGGMKRRGRKM